MGDLILAEKSDFVMLANTIREKTGSTDQMSFVDGFINGINNLGSGSAVEMSTVTIDVSACPTSVCYISNLNQEYVKWMADAPLDVPAPFKCIKGTFIYMNGVSNLEVVGGVVVQSGLIFVASDIVTIRHK